MKSAFISFPAVLSLFLGLPFISLAVDNSPFRILSTSSLFGNEIGICFSAPVDLASAADSRNYSLSDTNILITNATVRTDQSTVVLQLSQPVVGYSFVLIVGDLRSAANLPLANHLIAGAAGVDGRDIKAANIGAPPGSATVFACDSRSFDAYAPGSGIGETADSFSYVYHQPSLSYRLLVQITPPLPGIKQAGIMVRKSLDPGSPFLAVLISPDGANLKVSTLLRDSDGASASPWPGSPTLSFPSIPIWLLLQGTDQGFSASFSTNFWTLTQLGTVQSSQFTFPAQFFMGAAIVSNANDLDKTPTHFRYAIESPIDYYFLPVPDNHDGTITFSWPSVGVIEWTDYATPAAGWTLLTNNVQFGPYNNTATIKLADPHQRQFFRFRLL